MNCTVMLVVILVRNAQAAAKIVKLGFQQMMFTVSKSVTWGC